MNVENRPLIDTKFLERVIENNVYNKTIVAHYERYMAENTVDIDMDFIGPMKKGSTDYYKHLPNSDKRQFMNLGKAGRIANCNKLWTIDKYSEQKIKDVNRQNLCHDRFCGNCKKVKQAARMSKYIPVLEPYKETLHHIVLTVPNCFGDDLGQVINDMAKSFRELVRYIRCDKSRRISGISFDTWNYSGAIRSLEVTYEGDSYHPHYHVALVARTGLFNQKDIKNRYSFDHSRGQPELKTLFSKNEIIIQKIWYLLVNKIKVTLPDIEDLQEGYSCKATQFKEDDYAELFKYMSKDKDEHGNLVEYDQWKSLYEGLYRKKQIQGYGCFYQVTDDLDYEEYDRQWNEYISAIREKENPRTVYETPEILKEDTEYELVSRKSYFKYLKSL